MTAYKNEPLVGSVDRGGVAIPFPLEGLRKQAEIIWDTDDVRCGTCMCKATREVSTKLKKCDCRCHDAWRLWFRIKS